MAIKPILFNTEMVRANLDGRKICTRRLVSFRQFRGILPDKCKNAAPDEFLKDKRMMFKPYCDMTDAELIMTAYKAPYHTGDILYVRETFIQAAAHTFWYKADDKAWMSKDLLWKPSIHMPKEAARIWLKVTDVRVERLQDITEDGAKAEGAKQCYEQINTIENKPVTYLAEDYKGYYVLGFKSVWNSTIKKSDIDRYGWDANPYVWVISFERCEKPKG